MRCNFQTVYGPKIVFTICTNRTDREAVFSDRISLSILDMTGLNKIVEPTTPTPKNTSCTPKMKLPKTDLRKFSGDVLDWPELWDIFRVAVHDNPEIPPVQKFVYLKSLLTGEAAGYVANIKTEEANYDVAVQRLITKLTDMKPLEQSNKAMRDAVDELCALQLQGVTPKQYGALLMPLIESKLPKDWRLEWA